MPVTASLPGPQTPRRPPVGPSCLDYHSSISHLSRSRLISGDLANILISDEKHPYAKLSQRRHGLPNEPFVNRTDRDGILISDSHALPQRQLTKQRHHVDI